MPRACRQRRSTNALEPRLRPSVCGWRAFARRFPDVAAYNEEMLPLLTVLSVARGPIPFSILCGVGGASRGVVNQRLNRLRSWLKPQGDGDTTAYTLFHKSLRDWLGNRDNAGDYWCDPAAGHAQLAEFLATSWPGEDYALRHLAAHLVALARWDELCALLCDLRFVEARCLVGQVFELQADYRLALQSLPEAQTELTEQRQRGARAARWTMAITDYARLSNDGGEQPTLPEIPSVVVPWSDEQIQAECRRITEEPIRLDRLRAFAGFIETECYPLLKHGKRPGFVRQHAFNVAPAGPVHDAAELLCSATTTPLLLRCWPPNALTNPMPALLRTLEGHSDWVLGVSITPDRRLAVSAGRDNTVQFWNLENGACLHTLKGHSDAVTSVSITPDGCRAVSGSRDRTVRVWDLKSGACLRTLEGHVAWIWSVSVTPDGRYAVSGGDDRALRMWDLESGQCLCALEGHTDGIRNVAVTPDGRYAISGSEDRTLRVWLLESRRCINVCASLAPVYGVAVAHSSGVIVCGTGTGQVPVFEPRGIDFGTIG